MYCTSTKTISIKQVIICLLCLNYRQSNLLLFYFPYFKIN